MHMTICLSSEFSMWWAADALRTSAKMQWFTQEAHKGLIVEHACKHISEATYFGVFLH